MFYSLAAIASLFSENVFSTACFISCKEVAIASLNRDVDVSGQEILDSMPNLITSVPDKSTGQSDIP